MIKVYIRNPLIGQYMLLATFAFVTDAEGFIQLKRNDGEYPADTIFIMEVPNE